MLLRHWLDSLRGRLAWVSRFGKLPRRRVRSTRQLGRVRRFAYAADVLETRQMLSATAVDDRFAVDYNQLQTAVDLYVLDNDAADGATLSLMTSPLSEHGEVSVIPATTEEAAHLQFVPGQTYLDTISFDYQITDGTETTTATVTLDMLQPAQSNDPASDDEYTLRREDDLLGDGETTYSFQQVGDGLQVLDKRSDQLIAGVTSGQYDDYTVLQGESVIVDTENSYTYSGWFRAENENGNGYATNNRQYLGFREYDVDGNRIDAINVSKFDGATDTTLAVELNDGDDFIYVTNATDWSGASGAAHSRNFAWYGYADSNGNVYDDYTYTRNVTTDYTSGMWDTDIVDQGDGTWKITLLNPWAGGTISAGTAVRNAKSGSSYNYSLGSNVILPTGAEGWTYRIAEISKTYEDGQISYTRFRPGVHHITPFFQANKHAKGAGGETDRFEFEHVRFGETQSLLIAPGDGTVQDGQQAEFLFDGQSQVSDSTVATHLADELIRVNPADPYTLTGSFKSGDENGASYTASNTQYIGLAQYDIQGRFLGYSGDTFIDTTDQWKTFSVTVAGQSETTNQQDHKFHPETYYVRPVVMTNTDGVVGNLFQWRELTLARSWDTYQDGPQDLTFGGESTYTTNNNQTKVFSDGFLGVQTSQQYNISVDLQAVDPDGNPDDKNYFGFSSYDIDYKQIKPVHVLTQQASEEAELVVPFNPISDTVLYLNSTAGWSGVTSDGNAAHTRNLSFMNYADSTGTFHTDYSRYTTEQYDDGMWDSGTGITPVTLQVGNDGLPLLNNGTPIIYVNGDTILEAGFQDFSKITLSTGQTVKNNITNNGITGMIDGNGEVPVGTKVRNAISGSTYSYAVMSSKILTTYWQNYSAVIGGGILEGGANGYDKFRPGTSFIKLVGMFNWKSNLDDDDVTLTASEISWRNASIQHLSHVNGVVTATLDVLRNDKNAVNPQNVNMTSVTDPQFGTASISNGGGSTTHDTITYTTPGWFAGTDLFQYSFEDESGATQTATVRVNVLGHDVVFDTIAESKWDNLKSQTDPLTNTVTPASVGDYFSGSHDQVLSVDAAQGVLSNDAPDGDGDLVIANLTSSPQYGSLELNADGSFSYVPLAGYIGFDYFTYEATDGLRKSLSTVTLEITNAAPELDEQTFSVPENSPIGTVVGTPLATDIDSSEVLQYQINSGNETGAFTINSSGQLEVADSSLLDFESTPQYLLNITVTDALGESDTADITIAVSDENDTPEVSADQTFNINENSLIGDEVQQAGISAVVAASDPDINESLSYSITGTTAFAINASTGQITVADSSQLDFETTPSFVFTVTATDDDPVQPLSHSETVTINLNDINDAPTLSTILDANTNEDTPTNSIEFTISDVDVIGNTLSISANSSDQSLVTDSNIAITGSGTNYSLVITPELNQNGQVVITLTVNDNAGEITTKTFNLTVNAVNDEPVATGSSLTILEDELLTFSAADFPFSDVENDSLSSIKIVSLPQSGILTLDDGAGGSTPVLLDAEVTLSDLNSGKLKYLPAANEFGQPYTSFQYLVIDGTEYGNTSASLEINVTAVNDAPIDTTFTFTIDENSSNGTLIGTIQATDVDVDSMNYTLSVADAGGPFAVDLVTGELSVTDSTALDFETSPQFVPTIIATDSGGLAAEISVTIDLGDINESPDALTELVQLPSGQVAILDILGNSYDPEGDEIELILGTDPTQGRISIVTDSNGYQQVEYISSVGAIGSDSFSFTLRDALGLETVGTFDLQVDLLQSVSLLNDTGVADDSITTNPDVTGVFAGIDGFSSIDVEIDSDGDGIAEEVQSITVSDATDLAGFSFTPEHLVAGSNTVFIRTVVPDATTGENLTPDWEELSFELIERVAPDVTGFGIVVDNGDGTQEIPPNQLTGTLVGEAIDLAYTKLEFDYDGDDQVDAISWSDDQGVFIHNPEGLQSESMTLRVRSVVASRIDDRPLYSQWSSLALNIELPPLPGVSVINLIDDPGGENPLWTSKTRKLSGVIDGGGHGTQHYGLPNPLFDNSTNLLTNATPAEVENVSVEFDHDGDESVDGRAVTDGEGRFEYEALGLSEGENTIFFRTSIWDSSAKVYFFDDWSSLTFTLESVDLVTPTLTGLGLKNDDGADANDGVTTDPTISGSIAEGAAAEGITIEFSHSAAGETVDGKVQVQTDGSFQYVPVGLAIGAATIRARTVQWDAATRTSVRGDWTNFSFTWEQSSPTDPVIVWDEPADPGTGDPTPTDDLDPGTDAASGSFNTQVTAIAGTRDGLIDTAQQTYTTSQNNAEATFDLAVANANSDFNTALGTFTGVTTTFDLTTFGVDNLPPQVEFSTPSSPTSPTTNWNESPAAAGATVVSDTYSGATTNPGFENDPGYQQAVANAQLNHQNAVQSAGLAYESQAKSLKAAHAQTVADVSRTASQASIKAGKVLQKALDAANDDSAYLQASGAVERAFQQADAQLQIQIDDLLDQIENLFNSEEPSSLSPARLTLEAAFVTAWQTWEQAITAMSDYSEMAGIDRAFADEVKTAELEYANSEAERAKAEADAYLDERQPLVKQLLALRTQSELARQSADHEKANLLTEFSHRTTVAVSHAQNAHVQATASVGTQSEIAAAQADATLTIGLAGANASYETQLAAAEVALADSQNSATQTAFHAWASANPGPQATYQMALFDIEYNYVTASNSRYTSLVSASSAANVAAITAVANADQQEAQGNANASLAATLETASLSDTKTTTIADSQHALGQLGSQHANTVAIAFIEARKTLGEAEIGAHTSASKSGNGIAETLTKAIAQANHDFISVPIDDYTISFQDANGGTQTAYSNWSGGAGQQLDPANTDYQNAIQTATADYDAADLANQLARQLSWEANHAAWTEARTSASNANLGAIAAASYAHSETVADAEKTFRDGEAAAQQTVSKAHTANGKTAYDDGYAAGITLRQGEIDRQQSERIAGSQAAQQKSLDQAIAADNYRKDVSQAKLTAMTSWSATVNSPWSRYQLAVSQASHSRLTFQVNDASSFDSGYSNPDWVFSQSATGTTSPVLLSAISAAQTQQGYVEQNAADEAQYAHAALDANSARTSALSDLSKAQSDKASDADYNFVNLAASDQRAKFGSLNSQRQALANDIAGEAVSLQNDADSVRWVESNKEVNGGTGSLDVDSTQDSAENNFATAVSGIQKQAAQDAVDSETAYQNQVAGHQRTRAQLVKDAASSYWNSVASGDVSATSVETTYGDTTAVLNESLTNNQNTAYTARSNSSRLVYQALEDAEKTANQQANDAIRDAFAQYKIDLASEKITQLTAWRDAQSVDTQEREVAQYQLDLATANLAYVQATLGQQGGYQDSLTTAGNTKDAAIRTARNTSYTDIQAEQNSVELELSAWRKDVDQQTSQARLVYQKDQALAQQDRVLDEVNTRSVSNETIGQSHADKQKDAVTEYANWINNIASDQVTYLRNVAGSPGQDFQTDQIANLTAKQAIRTTNIDTDLTTMVQGVGDEFVLRATSLGTDASNQVTTLNTANATYTNTINNLPARPDAVLLAQVNNENAIRVIEQDDINSAEANYTTAQNQAMTILVQSREDSEKVLKIVQAQALVDFQLAKANRLATETEATATSSGLAADILSADQAAGEAAWALSHSAAYITYVTAQADAQKTYQQEMTATDTIYDVAIRTAQGARDSELNTAAGTYDLSTVQSGQTYQTDFNSTQAVFRTDSSGADQSRLTDNVQANNTSLVNQSSTERDFQNGLRPGAANPLSTAQYDSLLVTHTDTLTSSLDNAEVDWVNSRANGQQQYHNDLADADRDYDHRYADADSVYSVTASGADQTFEQSRITAQAIRTQDNTEASQDYAYAVAQARADYNSALGVANIAAMSEIDTRNSTPYSGFKLDEATAQAAAWDAVKTDYIALFDPAGTSNLVTADNSYETAAQAAWGIYILAISTADHQNRIDQAGSQTTLDKAQADATRQMTLDLSEVENNFQRAGRGLYTYTTDDLTNAGVDPRSSDDSAIYQGSVKTAWISRDSSQSTARLAHVTQLGNDYVTAEQTRAEANRIYQQAISTAAQTLKETQTAIWSTFTKLQATTYAGETAGWLTSPATPWHEEAAKVAAAQSTRVDSDQTAKVTFETAKNDAEFDYNMALETNRKTLRNDRAVASASKSLSDQQHLEEGESYSDDENGVGTWILGTAPADRYHDATITVPESLQPDASRDPESAQLRVGAEQFAGAVNLNNAFGSTIGNGDGEMSNATDPTSLAGINPAGRRGGGFKIENTLDTLGGSVDQVTTAEETNINWGGDLDQQETSTGGTTQATSEPPPPLPAFKTPTNNPNPKVEPETDPGGETSGGTTTSNYEGPPAPGGTGNNTPTPTPLPDVPENDVDMKDQFVGPVQGSYENDLRDIAEAAVGGTTGHFFAEKYGISGLEELAKVISWGWKIVYEDLTVIIPDNQYVIYAGGPDYKLRDTDGNGKFDTIVINSHFFGSPSANPASFQKKATRLKKAIGDNRITSQFVAVPLESPLNSFFESFSTDPQVRGRARSAVGVLEVGTVIFFVVATGGVGGVVAGGFAVYYLARGADEIITGTLEVNRDQLVRSYLETAVDQATGDKYTTDAIIMVADLSELGWGATKAAGKAALKAKLKRVGGGVDAPNIKTNPNKLPDNVQAGGNAQNGLNNANIDDPNLLPPGKRRQRIDEDVVPATAYDIKNPNPNTLYESNGYYYRSNPEGRLVEVTGDLRLNNANRNSYQQGKVGNSSGLDGDEGGHMIGTQFDGPGEGPLHMVPQSMNLNRGAGSAWARMERLWKRTLEAGGKVKIKITIDWPAGAKRPDGFSVEYDITDVDGDVRKIIQYFSNE